MPYTLIPQRLCYGPVGSATGGQTRLSFDEITVPEFRQGRYQVCHYAERFLGACVGPPALDQMLLFGLQLDTCLQDPSKFVAVQYEAEERLKVAVVTGAYLVLGQGWSADEVRRALPKDAGLTLPCSWITPRDLETSHGTPQMTVQDCWEGVQIARDLGWLSGDSVRDGVLGSLAASRFWKTTCQYDGAWLVPGVVFVMADPMTTIKDPSPATCPAFCRERGADPEPEASLDELRVPSKCSSATPPAAPLEGPRPAGFFDASQRTDAPLPAVCGERGSKPKALAAPRESMAPSKPKVLAAPRESISLASDLPWRLDAGENEATLRRDLPWRLDARGREDGLLLAAFIHKRIRPWVEGARVRAHDAAQRREAERRRKEAFFAEDSHRPPRPPQATPATASTATGPTTASERHRDGADDQLSGASVYTVCKSYCPGTGGAPGCSRWPDAKPFVEFLLEEGVAAVVRVNMPNEPGLAEIGGSYDAELLSEFGIRHEEVLVSDSKRSPSVPPHGAIRRFLNLARDINPEEGSAILVHCKGGFGRSVFLACLLVIYKYDVPGRGILGWARIARPGAITTPEQEAALRSLSGRTDLCRRYGIPWGDVPSMQGCCTVS